MTSIKPLMINATELLTIRRSMQLILSSSEVEEPLPKFTIVRGRASLIYNLIIVFPVKELDKVGDEARDITLEQDVVAPDHVTVMNVQLIVLDDD